MNIFKSRKLMGLFVALGLVFGFSGAAYADAAAKATVDAAKAQGVVGEQGDGYLGIRGDASAEVKAAVADINGGRAKLYADTGAKSGTSPAAAGEATAAQILGTIPAGQYYKPVGGDWTRK
jgi:uncharacterized protein YdbL (DUF1318 family)